MDCSMPAFFVLHCLWIFSNSFPLSQWYHPTISSSVIPFSSCLGEASWGRLIDTIKTPQISVTIKCFFLSKTWVSYRWSALTSLSPRITQRHRLPRPCGYALHCILRDFRMGLRMGKVWGTCFTGKSRSGVHNSIHILLARLNHMTW